MEGKNPDDKDDLYDGALVAITICDLHPWEFCKRSTSPITQKPSVAPPKEQKRPESHLSPPPPPSVDSDAPGAVSKKQINPVLELTLTLDPAHPFLADRGITPEVAREFGLGYCAQGIMKDRIAIPIHNERAELVAYAGRYANDEIPSGVDRYRLPKKFHKSLVLYNLHRAKELGKRYLVLVEGFWSAMRLHRAGIPTAALLGSSCSPQQVELIRIAGFKFVILLLDGDEAGRKGTTDAIEKLSRSVYVRQVELPDGMKPDSMPESWFERIR